MEPDPDTITLGGANQPMSISKSSSANPFSCNVCGKSYTRIDHLARHYRSHSQERPFVCKFCNKSFARVDLLKRHAIRHENDEEELHEANPASKRRRTLPDVQRPRAQRACQACAEAKARCEGSQPCLRCQQRSITCAYPPSRSKDSHNTEIYQASEAQSGHSSRINRNSVSNNKQQPEAQPSSTMPNNRTPSRDSTDPLGQISAVQTANFQLPTPSTFAPDPLMQGTYDQDLISPFHDMPQFDLMRDAQMSMDQPTYMDDFLNDDAFPKDVLDFGVDFSFDSPLILDQIAPPPNFEQMTSTVALHETEMGVTRSGVATPGLKGKLNIMASAQAFKESLWLWTPEKNDHGAFEQRNLSLPWDNTPAKDHSVSEPPPAHQMMSNMTRGKVLAMILRTCEPAVYSHVVSNFPNVDLLTHLIHNFVTFHSRSDLPWIHIPTIEVEHERPEFLASLIAYGAAISTDHEIRKLGFAVQEAQRMANPDEFERDNRLTRELRPLQSYALQLEVGLWSGDRRKMEIAESFAMPLVTMVRRAGHFRFPKVAELPPQQEDSGEALDSKWRNWVRQESFKRLALYLFYRDTRSSMSLLSQPLISYAELTAAPPCTHDLWTASTALQWKNIYLKHHQDDSETLDGRRYLLDDVSYILSHQPTLDVDVSLLLATASVWPHLWQYREMVTSSRNSGSDSRHGSLIVSSRRQELLQMLERIRINAKEWHVELKPAAWLLHEQCSMHLFASLDDIQLLAGKEGEDEARRIFPTMCAWAESSEARQALYHAGQILRAAREYPKFMLRDAAAVAVYHASLIFWAYAVTSKNDPSSSVNNSAADSATPQSLDFVRLDDLDGPGVRRFLVLRKGIPCIQAQVQTENNLVAREVPLSEPADVMRTTTRVLQSQHEGGGKNNPPLIENLSKLMHSLGRAYLARRLR